MIGEAQGGHLIAKIFNGSGDKATMTNELFIEKIKQIVDNDPALAQWLSAAVGGAVTGYMMFHADGENPVFEVTTFTEGLGIFWGHII